MEQNHIEHRPIDFKVDNFYQDRSERQVEPTKAVKNASTPANDTRQQTKVERPTPSPPRTALMCFSRSLRIDDIESAAKQFRAISPSMKVYWEDEARKDKARYSREKASHTGPWKMPKKRKKKHPLAPKRPPSAFLRFSKVMRKKVKYDNPDLDNTDISRLLGQTWRLASDAEKKPYQDKEQIERAIYKKDIARWRLIQQQKETDQALNDINLHGAYDPSLHTLSQPPELDPRDLGSHPAGYHQYRYEPTHNLPYENLTRHKDVDHSTSQIANSAHHDYTNMSSHDESRWNPHYDCDRRYEDTRVMETSSRDYYNHQQVSSEYHSPQMPPSRLTSVHFPQTGSRDPIHGEYCDIPLNHRISHGEYQETKWENNSSSNNEEYHRH